MKGRKIEYSFKDILPGDYWQDSSGNYHGMTPNGLFANLSNHKIIENLDGITVSPSILVKQPTAAGDIIWHGFLENGIWKEC